MLKLALSNIDIVNSDVVFACVVFDMWCVAMERLLKYANCTEETMQAKKKLWMKYCKMAERNLEWI